MWIRGILRTASQEWEVSNIQFVFNAILHDILDDRGPSGHLVGVFSDSFFSWNCILLFAITLWKYFYRKISEWLRLIPFSMEWCWFNLRQRYNWPPRNLNFWPCPVPLDRFGHGWTAWLGYLRIFRFWSSHTVQLCELCRSLRCSGNEKGID